MHLLRFASCAAFILFTASVQAAELPAPAPRAGRSDKTYEELFKSRRTSSTTDTGIIEILQRLIFGEVFYIGDLNNKDRELITVAALTALQTLPQLKAHIGAALNVGNTPVEVREAIYQCAPFIGFPRTLNAVAVFNEVMTERGIALPLEETATITEQTRFQNGAEIQNRLYGTEVKQAMQKLPETYRDAVPDMLTNFCFGDFYTRKGLNIKTRELLSLVILTALGAEKQLPAHILGAMRAGNSKETLLAAMVQLMPYIGMPNALTAINLIKETDFNSYKPIYEDK